jgi:hypothetical protein
MEKMVRLDDGPPGLQSIGEWYAGKELPDDLKDLTSLFVFCRQTGERFIQPDYYKIFLDPIAD